MKYQELKDKNESELQKLLKSNREKLRDLKFKVANKQLKNIREIREVKKLVSHILTALNLKKLAQPSNKDGLLPAQEEVETKDEVKAELTEVKEENK